VDGGKFEDSQASMLWRIRSGCIIMLMYLQGFHTCYINNIHLIKTHDMATVDDRMGPMIEGDALDDEFNHGILPLINPLK